MHDAVKRISKAVLTMAAHPATPWGRWIIGLAVLSVSLYLLVTEPDADKLHLIAHGVVGVAALLILPEVFETIAERVRKVIELYRLWKAPLPPPPPAP